MSDKPILPYWHLWTGSDGISRQTQCGMTEFHLKSMKPPAAPQWQGDKTSGPMTVMVTVQPVGWTGTWHENPKPQWIIPLSGRWFVESMDGQRVEMGAGEISFGGDQKCRTVDGKTGHMSGTIGDAPAVLTAALKRPLSDGVLKVVAQGERKDDGGSPAPPAEPTLF